MEGLDFDSGIFKTIFTPEHTFRVEFDAKKFFKLSEELDISGNAFSDKEIYIPYNFFIPMNKYKNILSSVNYECLEHYIWKDYNINHTSKHDAQLMIFKNNNG